VRHHARRVAAHARHFGALSNNEPLEEFVASVGVVTEPFQHVERDVADHVAKRISRKWLVHGAMMPVERSDHTMGDW
jgi:hypothetical protein